MKKAMISQPMAGKTKDEIIETRERAISYFEENGTPIFQTHEQKTANRDELKALATPLVEWIRAKHDPHTEVHISWGRVCVKHDGIGIPFPCDIE